MHVCKHVQSQRGYIRLEPGLQKDLHSTVRSLVAGRNVLALARHPATELVQDGQDSVHRHTAKKHTHNPQRAHTHLDAYANKHSLWIAFQRAPAVMGAGCHNVRTHRQGCSPPPNHT
eukprot:scaffold223712_cov18-Tisochrysis_lutea.AAC.1